MSRTRSILLPALLSIGLVVAASVVSAPEAFAGTSAALRELAPGAPVIPGGVAVDAAGDVFETSPLGDAVYVIPATTTTLFGQDVRQGVEVRLRAATGLDVPTGIAVDAAGNLFISNGGFADTLTVVPVASGSIFGQSVVEDHAAVLAAAQGIITPMGLAFDDSGDLFVVSDSLHEVAVIAPRSTSLFGQSASADTTTFLTATASTGLLDPSGIAIDTHGDLLFASGSNVAALSPRDTTLFGTTLQADVASVIGTSGLTAALGQFGDIEIDAAGDLLVLGTKHQTVRIGVIPGPGTTSVVGQPVTAGTPTVLTAATVAHSSASGFAVDAQGSIVAAALSFRVVAGQPIAFAATHVVAGATGTFCGIPVIAGHAISIASGMLLSSWLDAPTHVAVDPQGDAFVASAVSEGVVVVPSRTGVLFGQSVTRGVPTMLLATQGLVVPALAIDSNGNLVISSTGGYAVLAAESTSVFGQSATAGVLTPFVALATRQPSVALSVDPAGDLLGVTSRGIWVLPVRSGALYGRTVVAGRPSSILAATGLAGALAVDHSGDLFVLPHLTSDGFQTSVSVLATQSHSVFGQEVTAGALTDLVALDPPSGLTYTNVATTTTDDLVLSAAHFDNSGSDGELIVDAASSTSLWGQPFTAATPQRFDGSLDHGSYLAVASGPGNGLFALSATGLWGIGGSVQFTSGDHATARIGRETTIGVATMGGITPPVVSVVGDLPTGLTFADHGDGTATISGTPADGTPKSVAVTLQADDGVQAPVDQTLTLTVAAHDTLRPGRSFGVGHGLRSRSGVYLLVLSHRGNLVLKSAGGRRLWSAHTSGSGATRTLFTRHGVLKLVDSSGHRVVRFGARHSDPRRLRLLDSGDLVARSGDAITWRTDTAQTPPCSAPHWVC